MEKNSTPDRAVVSTQETNAGSVPESAQPDLNAPDQTRETPAPSAEPPKPRKQRRIRVWMVLVALVVVLGTLFVIGDWYFIQGKLAMYGLLTNDNFKVTSDGWIYRDDYFRHGLLLQGLQSSSPLSLQSRLVLPSIIDGEQVTHVDSDFSERCAHSRNVKQLVLPSSLVEIDIGAFWWMTNLESVEGGENIVTLSLVDTFSRSSPFFQSCLRQKTVVMGNGILVHALYDGLDVPDASVLTGTITVPSGINGIGMFAFDFPNGVISDSCTLTAVNLPDSIYLNSFSLHRFNGVTLTIPDGATVDGPIIEWNEWPDQLTDIWIGRNLTLVYPEAYALVYKEDRFQGTLHLADGATLETLYDFISKNSLNTYTLDCQRGAVPEDQIPDTVKVVYRD